MRISEETILNRTKFREALNEFGRALNRGRQPTQKKDEKLQGEVQKVLGGSLSLEEELEARD